MSQYRRSEESGDIKSLDHQSACSYNSLTERFRKISCVLTLLKASSVARSLDPNVKNYSALKHFKYYDVEHGSHVSIAIERFSFGEDLKISLASYGMFGCVTVFDLPRLGDFVLGLGI